LGKFVVESVAAARRRLLRAQIAAAPRHADAICDGRTDGHAADTDDGDSANDEDTITDPIDSETRTVDCIAAEGICNRMLIVDTQFLPRDAMHPRY